MGCNGIGWGWDGVEMGVGMGTGWNGMGMGWDRMRWGWGGEWVPPAQAVAGKGRPPTPCPSCPRVMPGAGTAPALVLLSLPLPEAAVLRQPPAAARPALERAGRAHRSVHALRAQQAALLPCHHPRHQQPHLLRWALRVRGWARGRAPDPHLTTCPPPADYELLSELSPGDVTLRESCWGYEHVAAGHGPAQFEERHLKYISLLGKVRPS